MNTIMLGERSMPAQSEKSTGVLDGLPQSILGAVIEAIFGFFAKLFSGFLVGVIF